MIDDPPVLELRGAGLSFGALKVLAGVDLTVMRGERVALIGPSGAGKSSLIALLSGSLAPTEGAVRILGRELATLSPGEL
ncbi:MAG: ATP-binding cassette domain-containing protein, partial [Candidatus Limnocylindria bacterium]